MYAGSTVRNVTQLMCPLAHRHHLSFSCKKHQQQLGGRELMVCTCQKEHISNGFCSELFLYLENFPFPWALGTVDWQFFKSFVHSVSFLTCQSSFNPTLETLNENHCSVGNPQCEKGKVHQTLSPPCLTYVLGCKCCHRNFLLFESKKFQIEFCCFFHHATCKSIRWEASQ